MNLVRNKKDPGLLFKTKVAVMVLLILGGVTITACSAVSGQNVTKQEKESFADPAVKTFSFYKKDGGKLDKWDVVYKDGKIKSVYRNGNEIPVAGIDSLKDMIAENLSDVDQASGLTSFRMPDVSFDSNFNMPRMKRMHVNISGLPDDSTCFRFNDKRFKMNMKRLEKRIKKFKHLKVDIDFDSLGLNRDMEELGENLSKMKIHVKIPDMSKFNKSMKHFAEEMRDYKFDLKHDLDMSNLHEKMSSLKESMKDLKIKMKDLDKELAKLKTFMNDVRNELVKDGVIKSRDEDFSMKLSQDEFIVNGKKQPDSLRDKYKKIYKKDFGKPLDHEMNFRTK